MKRKDYNNQYSSSTQRGEAGRGELWQPVPVPLPLLKAARELRKNMTDAERLLWQALRGKQLDGFRFRKQHPFFQYVIDFYCPSIKLAIELDGGQHNTEEGKLKDRERTAFLEQHGIHVLRFWNNEVISNLDGTLERILGMVQELNAPTTLNIMHF